MVLKDLIVMPEKITPYRPKGHTGTRNRRLVGGDALPSSRVEVILGELEPGGEARLHCHPDSEQVFYILEGKCRVQALDEECLMEAGMAVRFPERLDHRIVVVGERTLKCLVIYSPPIDKSQP